MCGLWQKGRINLRRPVCIIGLAFLVIIIIYLYCKPLPAVSLGEADGSELTLTGQVEKKEYRISNEQKVLVIYLREIQVVNPQKTYYQTIDSQISDSQLSDVEGIICYITDGREPKMGSFVSVRGKLRSFAGATNPGEFDGRRYYQILNYQARLQKGVILEESVNYDRFKEGLYQIKEYLAGLIDVCYDENDASVMKAMLLGEKSGLDVDTKQLYQLNGIIHILSISGLHISLIGMGFYKLLHKLKLPKLINIPLSICLIYCYGIMTGMSVSAFRAIVMFGLHIAAGLFGRTYDMLTAMAIAGIILLAGQPLYVRYSGFLFSFGAILAIGLLRPVMEEMLLGGTKLEKIMSTSLSVSIVTLPVYLCFYYEYPLYSVFLNLIIIPGTSLIVSDGLLTCAAAACFLPLGKFAALPAHILFSFYEICCKLAIQIPGSRNIIGAPDTWQILIFMSTICIAVLCSRKCSRLNFWQFILLAILCITLRFQDGLQITLIDVGQGDSIYIADDKGGHFLIDGGSSSKSDVGTYQILPFLKEEGTDTLTAIFVTHMDSDHYNGISTLIEDMDKNGVMIENLILPDIGEQSRSVEYHELESLAVKKGITVQYIHVGDVLRHGKLKLTCLHPSAGEDTGDSNASSTVLYLEYDDFTALFTGDLEGEGEKAVEERLKKYITDSSCDGKRITVLKVAHHGSRNSTEEAFLDVVSPQVAVISAGRDNRYGHPHEELLFRLEDCGSRIFRTDIGGAVTVTYKNGRVSVECFCK